MTVDLGDASGETPLARPEEIKKKYESYKKLLTEVIKQTQFEKDLNKRAFDRIPKQNLDPFKIKLIEPTLIFLASFLNLSHKGAPTRAAKGIIKLQSFNNFIITSLFEISAFINLKFLK